MRIKLEQLAQHLQKQSAPLYTLFGNEPLLILEAADLIRTHARQQGYTERELFTVLEGRCRVHDALGGFEEAGPGEGIYIPPGFEGAFEVLERLTKTYMICE